MNLFWIWPVWCLLHSRFRRKLDFPCFKLLFCLLPSGFCIPFSRRSFVILVRIVRSFAAQPLLFRCSSMSSSTLSNLYLDDEVEAHRVIFADYLWILHSQFLIIFANRDRNFRCFARQLLAFRCPSMSFPTKSTWCFDDEIENQEMILELTCWMAFVFLFFGEAFVILVRKFRFFAVQRLLFRCSSMSFPTMSTWCFDDGIEAHELILALTCLWFEIFFVLLVNRWFFDAPLVFLNIVNVIIKWRGWSSWNAFGSDLFGASCLPFYSKKRSFSLCEVFGVLLFGRCFFDFPQSHFATMSTWCIADEIETHEMILALTFLWFEVFLFCLSAVGFSMFLNVFFNLVNFIFRWWCWSSSSDLGRLFVDFAFTISNKLC